MQATADTIQGICPVSKVKNQPFFTFLFGAKGKKNFMLYDFGFSICFKEDILKLLPAHL